MYALGELELHAVNDGYFRLDGGAMFGIVPKPVWEKAAPADEKNRILLSLTTLVIRAHGKNILVDTGMGDRRDPRFLEMYAVQRPRPFAESLAGIGLKPGDIDFVVLTHLHFDHAGGATKLENGALVPAFPKATYVVQEGHWEEALDPNPRTKGSYYKDDFIPLRAAGRVRFVKGEEEIAPGVRVRLTGGHVRHHQIVTAESRGRKAVYWADLLPTAAHVKPAWTMGYDLYPHDVASIREKLVTQAAAEEWINVFEHDPQIAMALIRKEEKGWRVEPVERHS